MPVARFSAILMLLLAWNLAQGADSSTLCRVEGQVAHVSAGTPLKKVTVRLKRFERPAGVPGQPTVATYTTTTGPSGKFLFEDVEPGSYWLTAERVGFLEQSYGTLAPLVRGTPVKLASGQRVDGLNVKMTPQGFLYGKVSDEDGDPVPNAQVTVLKPTFTKGKRVLQQTYQVGSLDDGSFVIGNLLPGRYYLNAWDTRQPEATGPNASKPAHEGYALTYYPSVGDAAGASPVEVNPGGEVRGVDIRLRRQQIFVIRGKAVDTTTGRPAAGASLQMTPVGETKMLADSHNVGAVVGQDGVFEFQNVQPGSYAIECGGGGEAISLTVDGPLTGAVISRFYHLSGPMVATVMEGGELKPPAAPLVGRVVISVTNRDLLDVILPLGHGVDLQGTVAIENAQNPGQRTAVQTHPTLSLTPKNDASNGPTNIQAKEDGTFQVTGMMPDSYSVEVSAMPEGAYVKSIRLDGRECPLNALDLTSGAAGRVEILLSPSGGRISGTARNAAGEPAAGAMVQVWSAVQEQPRYGEADENGAFHVDSLAPGDYKVLSWEEVDMTLSSDPEFRNRFESRASSVKLGAGGRETVELKVVTREAIEAEAARMKL